MVIHFDPNQRQHVIEISEFRARLNETIAAVSQGDHEVVITRDGEPVSLLTRYTPEPKAESRKQTLAFGQHRNQIEIIGDIVSPMPKEWYLKDDDEDLT